MFFKVKSIEPSSSGRYVQVIFANGRHEHVECLRPDEATNETIQKRIEELNAKFCDVQLKVDALQAMWCR